MANKDQIKEQISLQLSSPSTNIKELNSRLATEFDNNATIIRSDLNKLYTHFILIEDIVEMAGKLAVNVNELLDITDKVADMLSSSGMKELSAGINRKVEAEGGQKGPRGGLIDSFETVKKETKKLFDARFFNGKEFGHQDITPSGLRLAAFATALEKLEEDLITLKKPTRQGEGRLKIPAGVGSLSGENLKKVREVKATVQKMIIGSKLVESIPMTSQLKNAPNKVKYLELARIFNEQSNVAGILRTEKSRFTDVKRGDVKISLKVENKEYNRFKNKFQQPFGTNLSRIFRGQEPSTALTKYFINKVDIGKLKGSTSIEDKIVKDIALIATGKKPKRERSKSVATAKTRPLYTKKVNLKQKANALATQSKKVKAKASKATKTSGKKENNNEQLQEITKLEALINKRLPAEVRRQMGRPALINQSNRFSNSVKL